jgi:hypothetical protein
MELAVGKNTDGTLVLFAVKGGGQLYAFPQEFDGNWQTSINDNGVAEVTSGTVIAPYTKHIAVGRDSTGRLEVFCTAFDDSIWRGWQKTPGSADYVEFTPFAGKYAKQIAAAQNEDGRMEIFYVGLHNGLNHN